MKKIDAHAHVFEKISSFGYRGELRALGNGLCRWANGEEMRIIPEGYGDKEFLGESLLRIMDEHDIEKAVLLQGSLYGFQNEYALETAAKYPDRFKAAVTLDPHCKGADSILDHLIDDLGAKIFKFEVSVGAGIMGFHSNFLLDDDFMMHVFDRIAQVPNATLVFDLGSPGMKSCQPEAVLRIAKKHPNLNIVVCHLLAPSLEDEEALDLALNYLVNPNIYVDLSALPWNTAPEEYPYPMAARYIKMAKNKLGVDKLIWGSDAPCVMTKFKYEDLYNSILEAGIFTEEELQDVFYQNAVRAYHLD